MRHGRFAWPFLCLAFTSCGSFQLSPEEQALHDRARAIPVANAITVTELQHFRELGPLDCEVNTAFHTASESTESCRDELKLDAARLGADVVVVESTDSSCRSYIAKDACLHMHGRAFQKLAASPTR